MASSGVNVLRWSALALGIVYGFSHQSSISAKDKIAHAKKEYERKQSLIQQAKQEFARQNAPPQQSQPAQRGEKEETEDPDFNLEEYLGAKAF